MNAGRCVSAHAPSDECKAARASKLLTIVPASILAGTYGDEVQRIANWHCMEHGLEEALVMKFVDTDAVSKGSESVITHKAAYTSLRDQGPSADAWLGGKSAEKALRKAHALEAVFLNQPLPGLVDLSWVTEEDEIVEMDEEFEAVIINAGDMSSDGGVVRVLVQDCGQEIDGKEMVITLVHVKSIIGKHIPQHD